MKHIITNFWVNTADRDGKLYIAKNGKPYKRVVIKVDKDEGNPREYDDEYLSCLVFSDDDPILFWKVGDEVDILVSKDENGRFNFKAPTRLDRLEERVKALETFLLKQ